MRKLRKLARNLYARLVPAAIQEKIAVYGKGLLAASGSIVQVVNLTVPEYGDETKLIVSAVAAALTFLGVVRKRNRTPEDARVIVGQRRRAAGA